MRHGRAIGSLAVASRCSLPGAARADIIAAVQVTGPDGSPDIAVMNATTGERATLPAGINTAAQELAPEHQQGRRGGSCSCALDPVAGTRRVIVLDTATGQTADLFNGFEVAPRPPSDPEIAPDGSVVLHRGAVRAGAGRRLPRGGRLHAAGQLPERPVHAAARSQPQYNFAHQGSHLASRAAGGDLHRLRGGSARTSRPVGHPQPAGRQLVEPAHSARTTPTATPRSRPPSPQLTLLVDRPLARRPRATSCSAPRRSRACPAPRRSCRRSSTPSDESLPAFTPRQPLRRASCAGHKKRDRLFVWDSQTQTLLNTGGDRPRRRWRSVAVGNLSLYFRPTFTLTDIRQGDRHRRTSRRPSGVGLFVQRITGRQRVLGKRAFKLRTVGRVPLGELQEGQAAQALELHASTASACGPAATSSRVRAVRARARSASSASRRSSASAGAEQAPPTLAGMATTALPTPERLLLAAPRGYCAGVDRAVQTVERALELYGAPVYVRKEIVHNKHVVAQLRERGAIFVEELDDTIPEGATTVFSAHGVSPAVHADAKQRNLFTLDATCPLVTKVHVEAKKFAAEGYTIVLIGHAGHEEVEGTMGEAPEQHRAGRDRGRRRRARHRRSGADRLHLPDHAVGRRDARDHQPPAREVPRHHRAAHGRHLLRDHQPPGRGQADGRRVRPRARDRLAELLQLPAPGRRRARLRRRRRT